MYVGITLIERSIASERRVTLCYRNSRLKIDLETVNFYAVVRNPTRSGA